MNKHSLSILFFTIFTASCSSIPSSAEQVRTVVTPNTDNNISFVSCPVYRDIDQGPKSGCWLVNQPETGIRYDVGFARSKPFIGRAVLVEGILSQEPNMCGGEVLKPVRISVLPLRCDEFIIPAEQYSGRAFQLPTEILQTTDTPREFPPPPYDDREYHIYFSMHSDFPIYQYSEVLFEKIALYIRASEAKKVTVTGFADTKGIMVSGEFLQEDLHMAERRSTIVAEAMRRLQVPAEIIEEQFRGDPELIPGGDDGLNEPTKRRVTVTIKL